MNEKNMPKQKHLPVVGGTSLPDVLVFFPLVLFFALASYNISQPGIYYDEIFFANAALGIIDPDVHAFIFYKIGNFPIFLMSYIGALKAYLYYPIFALFGVSAATVRLPMILLSTLALYILYKALALYFNRPVAFGAVAMLAVDPSFISCTRYDPGPVVIEFFLKILCLYLFARFLSFRKYYYLWLIFFLMALGLFNKLNFIWFINSFFFAALAAYGPDWRSSLLSSATERKWIFISLTALAYLTLAGSFWLLSRLFLSHKTIVIGLSGGDFLARLTNVYGNLKSVLNGQYFYNWIFGHLDLQRAEIFWIFIAAIILAGLLTSMPALFSKKGRDDNYGFFVLLLALMLAQIALTRDAFSGWHIFSIFPLHFVLLSYYAWRWGEVFPVGGLRRAIPLMIIAIVFAYNLSFYTRYLHAYDHPHNPYYSNAIYDLIQYTKETPGKFVSIDWGTHAQLLAFNSVPGKYEQLAFFLNELDESHFIQDKIRPLRTYFNPGRDYFFIMYPLDKTNFKKARENFFKAAANHNVQLNLYHEIKDSRGRVIYEIYNIKQPACNHN